MKLVDDAQNWSKWWSVRLSLIGGTILTILEALPHVVTDIIHTLPSQLQPDESVLKVIGLICVICSPIARIVRQQLPEDSK